MPTSQFSADTVESGRQTMTESFETEFTVYVVEDVATVRRTMVDVIGTMNMQPVGFNSAESFLDSYDGKPGVLVCDMRMPGMTGLELQKALADRKLFIPFVMVTGFAATRFVVEATKNGAIAVLEKPFSNDDLWLAVRAAMAEYNKGHDQHKAKLDAEARVASLTTGEKDVLKLVLQGLANKVVARKLDVSIRTVEARRQRILQKMHVESIVELVRAVDLANADRG